MPLIVAARVVEGLGVGGLAALPFVVIPAAYAGQAQARMLAAVSSMWLVPGLIGPPLASAVAEAWSWRVVFGGLAGLLVLAAPLCLLPLRTLPRSSAPKSSKRILWPALALLLAAAALIEGLRRPDALGAALTVAGLVGVVIAMRPLFPAGLWTLRPGLPSALAVRGFIAFAQMGLGPFMTLALRRLHDLSLRDAGWIISIGASRGRRARGCKRNWKRNTAPAHAWHASGEGPLCSPPGWFSLHWACWGRCRSGRRTWAGWWRAPAWVWHTTPTACGP
ncbi:MFS transporter [Deinococcus radiodurans]|nr:MFS transporter [Deinococcus radiodurans]